MPPRGKTYGFTGGRELQPVKLKLTGTGKEQTWKVWSSPHQRGSSLPTTTTLQSSSKASRCRKTRGREKKSFDFRSNEDMDQILSEVPRASETRKCKSGSQHWMSEWEDHHLKRVFVFRERSCLNLLIGRLKEGDLSMREERSGARERRSKS